MPVIQWYPGHIAKAERKLREQLNLVDVVIEVIDARIPESSRYENIDKLLGNKPRIMIMNKSDLGDPIMNSKWIDYLKKETGLKIIPTTASSAKDISSVVSAAVELGKEKIDRLVAKGMLPRPTRAMVVGMPNVGKSSIINKLIKKTKAKTGAKAGITRQQQWVRVNPKLELLDTPGIIPMKLEDQQKALKLAFVHSVSENAFDVLEVSKELANFLYNLYPEQFCAYYKIENTSNLPTLEDIAVSRKLFMAGEKPDTNRCAALLLSDFRHGRIGRMTLDSIPKT